MKGQYLSKIIDINDLRQGKLNLIYTPCGSGKTTFAKTKLKELTRETSLYPMLYLIDTAIGKEQLLHSSEPKKNMWTGELYWELDGITVYTYAGYVTLCKLAPDHDAWEKDAIIVCDELQNPIKWCAWDKGENNEYALGLIENRINMGNNIVIAISATPNKIKEEFGYCLHEVPLHGEPLHYVNDNIDHYRHLQTVLNRIKPNQKGIIYTSQVRDIIKYQAQLEDRGIKAAGIWSINNKDRPMSDEQKQIRDYIIKYQKIPSYVDVLLINKASETSINIYGHIDFMIVHDSDEDTQIQTRGRYRNDLEQLYLYDKDSKDEIVLDEKWLGKPLYKTDKDALCEEIGLKENRRLLKWTSVKQILINNGYEVIEKRTKKERFTLIG